MVSPMFWMFGILPFAGVGAGIVCQIRRPPAQTGDRELTIQAIRSPACRCTFKRQRDCSRDFHLLACWIRIRVAADPERTSELAMLEPAKLSRFLDVLRERRWPSGL